MTSAKRAAVLALCLLLCGAGWWLSKRYVARNISDLVAKKPEMATVAFSEMTKLGWASLPALLDSATDPDRRVASPARRQVEMLLANKSIVSAGSGQALSAAVVKGLKQREPRLTPSGRRWARRVGDKVLAMVPQHDVELIKSVEELFGLLLAESHIKDQPLIGAPVTLPRPPSIRQARPAPLIASAPPSPPAAPDTPSRSNVAKTPPVPTLPAAPPVAAVREGERAGGDSASAPQPFAPPASATAIGPSGLAWKAPVTPKRPVPQIEPPKPQPSAERIPARAPEKKRPPLARQLERERMRRIVNGPPDPPRQASPEVVKLLEGDATDRLALVEKLLTGKYQDAVEHLFTLAKDPSPRVRVAAISALGASSNPKLTEAAWRLAIHDEDPRVARLAGELQKLLR